MKYAMQVKIPPLAEETAPLPHAEMVCAILPNTQTLVQRTASLIQIVEINFAKRANTKASALMTALLQHAAMVFAQRRKHSLLVLLIVRILLAEMESVMLENKKVFVTTVPQQLAGTEFANNKNLLVVARETAQALVAEIPSANPWKTKPFVQRTAYQSFAEMADAKDLKMLSLAQTVLHKAVETGCVIFTNIQEPALMIALPPVVIPSVTRTKQQTTANSIAPRQAAVMVFAEGKKISSSVAMIAIQPTAEMVFAMRERM